MNEEGDEYTEKVVFTDEEMGALHLLLLGDVIPRRRGNRAEERSFEILEKLHKRAAGDTCWCGDACTCGG